MHQSTPLAAVGCDNSKHQAHIGFATLDIGTDWSGNRCVHFAPYSRAHSNRVASVDDSPRALDMIYFFVAVYHPLDVLSLEGLGEQLSTLMIQNQYSMDVGFGYRNHSVHIPVLVSDVGGYYSGSEGLPVADYIRTPSSPGH